MENPLLKRYKNEERWVNWKKITRNGKTTKPPFSPITKGHASSVKPKDWASFAEAEKVSSQTGIIFTSDQKLLGIDVDHCLTLIDGKPTINHPKSETIAELLLWADTYTEISPSGEGLHLYLEIEEALPLEASKHEPWEVYTNGRFFTFSGNSYHTTPQEVRKITLKEAHEILKIIGYPWGKGSTPTFAEVEASAPSYNNYNSGGEYNPLDRMFASKNGAAIEALYNGDISKYLNSATKKPDASSADMALCSHLAFWTQKNAQQMEQIWMASPLGQRPKTQDRPAYRKATIKAAILGCREVFSPPATPPQGLDLLYTMKGKEKIYTLCVENIYRVLNFHPEFHGKFRIDLFKSVMEIADVFDNKEGNPVKKWRLFEDKDTIIIQKKIQIYFQFFQRVGKDMVFDAIVALAFENAIDSAADYIKSLKWDEVPRLDSWLTSVYGVEDKGDKGLYHKAVGANWIKGMVKRLIIPGCKFDYVLVLEGPQGIKKSMSLSILGGAWHLETTASIDNKDFLIQMRGKAIIEFSEGETLSRAEVKKMKAVITTTVDTYRPPYGRVAGDFPRRCVFAMTTNQEEYLKDETGGRRWLPVTVVLKSANVEWLQENREQLFAEAYHRAITKGETVYEFPDDITKAEQFARRERGPNADTIVYWYVNICKPDMKAQGVTIGEVFEGALANYVNSKELKRSQQMEVANILKEELGLEKRQVMMGGARSTRWYQPGAPTPTSFMETKDEELIRLAAKD